jgi:hypothetical protein
MVLTSSQKKFMMLTGSLQFPNQMEKKDTPTVRTMAWQVDGGQGSSTYTPTLPMHNCFYFWPWVSVERMVFRSG